MAAIYLIPQQVAGTIAQMPRKRNGVPDGSGRDPARARFWARIVQVPNDLRLAWAISARICHAWPS